MEHPKPRPPKPQTTKDKSSTESRMYEFKSGQTEKVAPSKSPKKPYVLRPHLTDRPLRNNEVLVNLQKAMVNPTPQRRRKRQK